MMNKPGVRAVMAAMLTIAVMVLYVYRLMTIQMVEADKYKKVIGENTLYKQVIKSTRGEIVDRGGEPLASNRMGYNVIIDKAAFPSARQNEIIIELIRLFEKLGEVWEDNLPISKTAPFYYLDGRDNAIASLKKRVDVNEYATAPDVMFWLEGQYGTEGYSPEDARKIIGIRYEMERRGFNFSTPYTFATDIRISSVIEIKERSYLLSGVDIVESPVRVYPNGIVAPHLIGLTGPVYEEEYEDLKSKGYSLDDIVGKSGSELAFEDNLRGKDGVREIFCDSDGKVIESIESTPPIPGNTVVLTIDKKLQLATQAALEKQIKNLQETAPAGKGKEADVGAAVMIEVKTGKILACATYPSYDLNRYYADYTALSSENGLKPLYNRALLGTYAPGSCFKPVVAVAGLGTGICTHSSTFLCSQVFLLPGSPQRFTCLSLHGNIDVINALRWSCNIYFYNAGHRMGIDMVDKTAMEFGLGEPTGIELRESKGVRSNPESKLAAEGVEWYPGDTLQSSIGQLYHSFTPLQLANYAATIANRGDRMKLSIIDEIRDYSRQTVIQPYEPVIADKVEHSREAFEIVVDGMVAASRIGTAVATFGGYPVDVASKTGTPESTDLPNSTFICFAPAEDPAVAIAVVIEKGWHGYTGAPVARDMFNEYFGYNRP